MEEKEEICVSLATHAIGLDRKNHINDTEDTFILRTEIIMMLVKKTVGYGM